MINIVIVSFSDSLRKLSVLSTCYKILPTTHYMKASFIIMEINNFALVRDLI